MASSTNSLLEAAAIQCLLHMNRERLNRTERDGASDVLFSIYAGLDRRITSNEESTCTNNITPFKPTTDNASIPLSSPVDADSLSPLQCYIRSHCVEYFEATESEGADSTSKNQQQRGRRTPIVVGRVGIRCVFCKDCPFNKRASQHSAFPSNLDKIYSSVVMWQCRHAPQCREIPSKVRKHMAKLKRGHGGGVSSNGAARNSIWAASAKEKGLVNTKDGIKFLPSPNIDEDETELSRINSNAVASNATSSATALVTPKHIRPWVVTPDDFVPVSTGGMNYEQLLRDSDLVSVQDPGPAYLVIAFAQYQRCYLTNEDKIGAYKSRKIGCIGICCKWCDGEPFHGGRYFPNKRESLGHTTMLQSIVKHVCSCSSCPQEIQQAISSLSDTNPSGESYVVSSNIRSRKGAASKADFIKTVWSRLHDARVPNDAYLFRPIQQSDAIDPTMEYESLKANSLTDDRGRRVSVCIQGLSGDCAVPNKKSKTC